MCQLPSMCGPVPRSCAENRKIRPHLQTQLQLAGFIIRQVYRQADTGGVLLSSMGNPEPYPIYWDKLLINASQVTNPSIDPLREPMETRTFLGRKTPVSAGIQKGAFSPKKVPGWSSAHPYCFPP